MVPFGRIVTICCLKDDDDLNSIPGPPGLMDVGSDDVWMNGIPSDTGSDMVGEDTPLLSAFPIGYTKENGSKNTQKIKSGYHGDNTPNVL